MTRASLAKLVLFFCLAVAGSSSFAQGIDQAFIRPTDQSFADRLLVRAGFSEIKRSYALVIGIDEFDAFSKLPTSQDPIRIKDYLIDEAGFDHVHLLTGDKVTKERLEELMLDEFRQAVKPQDRFLFYWSGHGVTIGQGPGARGFLPLKSSAKGRISTMVSMDDIADWDSYLDAHQVLYLMDSCFSGLVGAAPQSDLEQITREQLSGPSRHVITAGRADEQTIAVDQLGGSVFTHALLKGLRGAADSANALGKDDLVSVGELKAYLGQEVTRLRERFRWQNSITPQIRDLEGSDGAFFFPISSAFPVDQTPPSPQPGDQTREVQQALADLGYYPGPINGQLTLKTKSSLIRFQQDQDLAVTGLIDEATLERMPFALAGLVQTLGEETEDSPADDITEPPTPSNQAPVVADTLQPCATCPRLVAIVPEEELYASKGSSWAHKSPAPFFLSETEVTIEQFREYAEATNIAFVDTKTSAGPTCFAWQKGDRLRKTAMAFNLDTNLAPNHPVSCVQSRGCARLYRVAERTKRRTGIPSADRKRVSLCNGRGHG